MFRKKKEPELMGGCDPEVFADEIRPFLARAAEVKVEGIAAVQRAAVELEEDLEASNRRRNSGFADQPSHSRKPKLKPQAEPASSDPLAPNRPGRIRSHGSPATSRRDRAGLPAGRSSRIRRVKHPCRRAKSPNPLEAERIRRQALETEAAEARALAEGLQREAQERTENLRREAEEHRLEAERLRAEAEAAAERALHESLRRQEAEAEAEAAERERQADMRRLRAEVVAAAERAREQERARLEAEAAMGAAVERARQEERARLEEAAAMAAEQARAEERRRIEAEATAATARAREEERARVAAQAASAADHAREEERARLVNAATEGRGTGARGRTSASAG